MSTSIQTANALSLLLLVAGCATPPGTRPLDQSAAAYERAAEKEEAAAQAHASQYDPEAREGPDTCDPANEVCWEERINPTEYHLRHRDRHRDLAETHRAASQTLRTVEADKCAGLSDEDRDMSPFAHQQDIQSVQELPGRADGAEIAFRAVPGMTAEWLQRLVECHQARAAALGFRMEGMEYCPLNVKNVTATVQSVGNGFAVRLEADDAETAAEVLKRAKALQAEGGS